MSPIKMKGNMLNPALLTITSSINIRLEANASLIPNLFITLELNKIIEVKKNTVFNIK